MSNSNSNSNDGGYQGKFEDKFPWHTFVPRSHESSGLIVGYFDLSEFYGATCHAIAVTLTFPTKTLELYLIPPEEDVNVQEMNDLLMGDSIMMLDYNDDAWANLVGRIGTFDELRTRINSNSSGSSGGGSALIHSVAGNFSEGFFSLFNDTVYPRYNEGRDIVIGYVDVSQHYGETCSAIGFKMIFSAKKIELFFIPSVPGKSVKEMTKEELVADGNCFLVFHYKFDNWNSLMEELDTVKEFRAGIPSASAGSTGGGSAAATNNNEPYEPLMTLPKESERRRRRGKSKRRNTKKQRKTRRRLRK